MATLSGKTGTASFNNGGVLRVTGWTATETALVDSYAASDTGGYKMRVAGPKDFTATVKALYDTSIVPVVGQSANLALVIAATPLVLFTSTAAMIDSVQVEVDLDTGAPVSYVLTLSGNGAALIETYVP